MDWLFNAFLLLISALGMVKSAAYPRLCDGEACNKNWTPVPNMGAALVGYNPVISNSLEPNDPGRRNMIFVPTFTHPAPDNRIEVNPNIDYFDDIHCSLSQVTTVVTSFEQYARQEMGSIKKTQSSTSSSSSKIPLFSIFINYSKKESQSKSQSTQTKFQKDVSFFKEKRGEIYINKARCQVYRIEVSDFAKPVFTDGFLQGLKELAMEAEVPAQSRQKTKLKKFIESFGTHYLSRSWLGATLSVESRFESQSSSQRERNQRKSCIGKAFGKALSSGTRINTFDVAAEYKGVSVATEVGGQGSDQGNSNSQSSLRCSSFDALAKGGGGRSFKGIKEITVGAYPNSDRDEWAKSSGEAPRVIEFDLKPISNLFTAHFLEGIAGVEGKADLLKKYFEDATADYCQTMLGEECPDAKGCGINGLCPFEQKCEDDENEKLGFRCIAKEVCEAYSQAACKAAIAKLPGVSEGSNSYSFAGDYSTKGCYYYTSGTYQNQGYFGTGGTDLQKIEALTGERARPNGHDCGDRCVWGAWSSWSTSCNQGHCSSGSASRTKTMSYSKDQDLVCRGTSRQEKTNPTSIKFNGDWGTWGQEEYCGGGAYNGYAVSFEVRVDGTSSTSDDRDDTAINSICLICSGGDKKCSKQGWWGTWVSSARCNHGFNGFQMKYYDSCGGKCDDVTATDLRLKCSDRMTWVGIASPTAGWGSWKPEQSCPTGFVICGLKTRIAPSVGSGDLGKNDDTALNGVEFRCCRNIW